MHERASTTARVFWAAAAALLALAVVLTVQLSLSLDDADSTPVAPLCADVDLPDPPAERVTCRTRSATLTIAGEGHPVVLERTEARVVGSSLDRRILAVRVRLRRDTGTYHRRGAVRRQVYLRVGDERLWPLAGRTSHGTRLLRFALSRAAARAVRRGDVRPELGIVAWDQLGEERPARLGVVRLAPRV